MSAREGMREGGTPCRGVAVVGVGPGDPTLLTGEASQALEAAELIVGARRVVAALPAGVRGRRVEAVGTARIVAELADAGTSWAHAAIVVSGDVGLFSGARDLPASIEGALPGCVVRLVPGISSLQLLAARLRRSWEGWHIASAHGVACDVAALVRAALSAGTPGEPPAPVFLVTGGATRAHDLCARLVEAGLGAAHVSVGERLGYPDERLACGSACELARETFDSLAVMLIDPPSASGRAAGEAQTPRWPFATGGIPDELFERGAVPMTKQEVRAAALAKLRLRATDVAWDVGAGTGSVSVEMALAARAGRVLAVERTPRACELIRRNAAAFGCANLELVEGEAPEALRGLPTPDAVFVGGSGGALAAILAQARAANPAVRVCVACVTLETLAEATRLLAGEGWAGFEACQISVARTDAAGSYHLMRAQNPVFLVSAVGDAGPCADPAEMAAR